MSAVVDTDRKFSELPRLPLIAHADLARAFAWHEGREISAAEFLADVFELAERLPEARYAVNLCTQRYDFLVAFCAAVAAGQTNLLPASRAPQAIADVLRAYPDHYALTDDAIALPADLRCVSVPAARSGDSAFFSNLSIPVEQVVAIGFTSGSTGAPKANPKSWGGFAASSALNVQALAQLGEAPQILATVPPQHMYGLELSVLLPLRSCAAIHTAQPLFPADIVSALAQMPEPRVLVTTPFHLRALFESQIALPPLAGIVTATAPLAAELALAVEQRYATRVLELFGSTETCVIAQRHTAHEEAWSLYDGIELQPQPDGTLAHAPYFAAPTLLQDVVELLPERRFALRGRSNDLLEIAGKRASLGDITRRLLAIEGVEDAHVFQLDADADSVRRLAALVVAPGLDEVTILNALRQSLDAVFLPRPLKRVATLPRNATGKLPREAVLEALGLRTES